MLHERPSCTLHFAVSCTIEIGHNDRAWQRVALTLAVENRYRVHCSRLIEQLASVAVSVLTATGTTGIPVAPFCQGVINDRFSYQPVENHDRRRGRRVRRTGIRRRSSGQRRDAGASAGKGLACGFA
ncbi:putative lipoprotein [Pseudomonas amygdali pv. morsprunorum]|uniref:Putative lipoprotein n=1 Tax=Pseudomonas amygdali pv. morsprunorum TaxID=129138 RepID=A0A3M2WRE4_PSEA0|nr:putative lipoprotein [Pseudomonas amygdali pv. morsprunorum]